MDVSSGPIFLTKKKRKKKKERKPRRTEIKKKERDINFFPTSLNIKAYLLRELVLKEKERFL